MDFQATDEQRLIADSFAKVFERLNADETGWTELAELGLLDATLPEAAGGIGAGLADMFPALVECGRSATLAPVIGASILPGLALSRAGDAAPKVPEGTLCLGTDTDVHIRNGRLTGTGRVVPGADMAEAALLCLPDNRLAVLSLSAQGVARDACTLVDGRGAADLIFVNAPAGAIGDPVPGLSDWLTDAAATAFAVDALGALFAIREMTQSYLGERKQFGRPLGSFQSLQHAMVDIHHDTEHFLSLTQLAALACDADDHAMRVRAVASVKTFLGGRMRKAAATAIQLHGGIGVTEEYALGRLVKRVLLADMLNGSADAHAARLARLIAEETRDGMAGQKPKEIVA